MGEFYNPDKLYKGGSKGGKTKCDKLSYST